MEKVLLVGKFTDQFREINKKLSVKYEVRACVNKLEIFRGMFKLNKPDVIVMLLGEMNETNESLLREIQKEHCELPVVCAGVHEEIIKRIDNLILNNAVFLSSSYTVEQLIEKVDYVLNENFVESMLLKSLGVDVAAEDEELIAMAKNEKKEEKTDAEANSKRTELGNNKKTILTIDDSGVFLRMLNGILHEEYDVRMATSCQKALVSICEKKPDLILLDYEMPICNGRETMIKIREIESNKNIPIVFVTAVNKVEHIKAVLSLKPAGYVLKPIDKDKLLELIKSIIG